MKTQIKFIILLLLVGVFATSCEDALHIDQKGELTADVTFENIGDIQKGLNGAYQYYSAFNTISFNARFTDNIVMGINSGGQGRSTYAYNLTPTSGYAEGIWGNRYTVIDQCNRVLEALNNLHLNSAEAKHIAAQLIGLRAIAHFDLFQYYAESYTDMNALAIPISDTVRTDISYQPARNTVGEVYAFLKQQIDKAETLFGSFDEGVTYLNADVMEALRARIQLYKQDYAGAITTTKDLLDKYPLADTTQYPAVFKDLNNAGIIWKKNYVDGDAGIAGQFYFNAVGRDDSSPYIQVSNELFDQLDSNDVRIKVVVLPRDHMDNGVNDGSVYISKDNPDNILLVGKYPGSGDGFHTNDLKIFRSAEMLLIKAEAEARMGNVADAQDDIQYLLDNRFTANTPVVNFHNSKHEALLGILKQRRLELAYEGHRYLDLKRFRDVTNQGVTRLAVDCASFGVAQCDLPKQDHRWIFPIPNTEIRANSVITQNPGY